MFWDRFGWKKSGYLHYLMAGRNRQFKLFLPKNMKSTLYSKVQIKGGVLASVELPFTQQLYNIVDFLNGNMVEGDLKLDGSCRSKLELMKKSHKISFWREERHLSEVLKLLDQKRKYLPDHRVLLKDSI